jgi:hypothetical protein
MYTVKKMWDVWAVLDTDGNQIEECPTRRDAVGFAARYNAGEYVPCAGEE